MTVDHQTPVQPATDGQSPVAPFATVAIGTSAGGVRALQMFFESLPDEVEAAFVVVLHLDPEHHSELPSILATRTKMPVTQVAGREQLQPGRVYVIPPNRQMRVDGQHLDIAEFDEPRWRRAPIDLFFRSLAARRSDDIAVLLSGAGSDGALGVKAVKEAGGIILVQDPDEAEFGSMPRSAIATGLADFVLPVREIAARLPELIRNRGATPLEPPSQADEEAIQRILSQLRARTGHDFSSYKKSTVRRRVLRRMQVQRATTMNDYLAKLRDSAQEAQALFADLLISVTTFFRDADAFEKLGQLVVPRLFEDKGAADTVRVWVPGCATGEEAYSIAMMLLEEAGRREIRPEIQIFASDLDETALAFGREGRYPLAIETDVSEERLRRFFAREGDQFRVTRELRDVVLFARHSLLKDPPFSHTDLVSCRNLLIYLDRDRQQQVCGAFHFALNPSGFLFLGSSESADSPPGLFRAVDRDSRIYARMPAPSDVRLTARFGSSRFGLEAAPFRPAPPFRASGEPGAHREALERLAPPSVVVDESYRVVHLSETAGRYIQPSSGPLANDLTELAREELRFDLRALLHRAFSRNEASLSGPIAVRFDGASRRVYLQVRPQTNEAATSRSAVVFFFEGETFGGLADGAAEVVERAPNEEVRQLRQELQVAQSQLRVSRDEYEGANEELRAANEEMQSINEEYRSTAEELETSKEELQSINEELQTVNAELKTKLETVSAAHSDIQNLMAATDVGILFLDNQLRIKRFTPPVSDLFNVEDGDEGRSITDFTHTLDYNGLAEDARSVLRDLKPSEREVLSLKNGWRLMRMKPYRTVEDRIDGVVVTFVDIGERRRADDALRDSEARARAVIDGVADAIVTFDEHGLIQSINKATTAIFGFSAEELIGGDVDMLVADPHRALHDGYIARYLRTGEPEIIGVGRELLAMRKDGSQLPVEIQITETWHGAERLFIGFIRDLSERRNLEARLGRLHRNRLDSLSDMATALAHEINQPLAAASNYLFSARHLLGARGKPPEPAVGEALDKASAQLHRAGQIIAHLREFVARGEPNKIEHGLHDLIRGACELIAASAKEADVEILLSLEAADDRVFADKVQIEQALVNLMRNAVDAMEQSPVRKLSVSTWLDGDMIRTDVADTGCGLPASTHAELFMPFNSTKSSGLGVGLSISRSIIEAHYGMIWAEDNSGGGARLSFTLPLARLEEATE